MTDAFPATDGKVFAARVTAGEGEACREFVDTFSDLVLLRVIELMKGHCRQPAWDRACSLRVVLDQRRGAGGQAPPGQCDECMDSYIWFFEILKRKAKTYRGTNNCSLRTFVRSVLNSQTTYVDWLRWRYGRAY
jgi:hypothetical protein